MLRQRDGLARAGAALGTPPRGWGWGCGPRCPARSPSCNSFSKVCLEDVGTARRPSDVKSWPPIICRLAFTLRPLTALPEPKPLLFPVTHYTPTHRLAPTRTLALQQRRNPGTLPYNITSITFTNTNYLFNFTHTSNRIRALRRGRASSNSM
eukprot:COSAG02_NODE_7775_length_2851_cov_4.294331_5_plen_152_part_00